jgi:glycosyltransferase involved in cell wall biosynthesis
MCLLFSTTPRRSCIAVAEISLRLPRIAYILHWFPEPSETFIFNEVVSLHQRGLDLRVFTLYGELKRPLSPSMSVATLSTERLGIASVGRMLGALRYWRGENPGVWSRLFRTVPVRRWSDAEMAGENLWGFLSGFELARRCLEEGIRHIHAPWANGPATAAWVASTLSSIPFSFAAHATDIYPPDGALEEKIEASAFVRTENMANVNHLCNLAGSERDREKIKLVYSGHPLRTTALAEVRMKEPYRLLAVGRFVRKKGFDDLLRACAILSNQGLDYHLVLVGSGPLERTLKRLALDLGVGDRVTFPGFVLYDRVPDLLTRADVFLMPSIVDPSGDRDGLPNVIVEALLQRVPVVATDVCGIREVIQNGVTGILAPQKDPAALARAVFQLIENREQSVAMAQAGRDLVLDRFNADRCFGAVFDLIMGALDQ